MAGVAMSGGDDDAKSWEEVRAQRGLDERAVAAYKRLLEAEQLLCELWEQRGTGMDWIGEALGSPIEQDAVYVAELGQKVAALGGHLELIAVLPDGPVTLVREPRDDDAAGPLE